MGREVWSRFLVLAGCHQWPAGLAWNEDSPVLCGHWRVPSGEPTRVLRLASSAQPPNPSTIPFNVPEGRITLAAFAGSGR